MSISNHRMCEKPRAVYMLVFNRTAKFCKRSKLVAAHNAAAFKIKHLAGNSS